MRFESQLSRMSCQTFSTGLSSGHLGGEGHEGDVRRHDEPAREVPSGPVDEEHGMGSQRHLGCDLGQVQVHGFGVVGRQDQGSSLALARADGAEDVGRGRALIVWRRGPRSPPGPPPCDLVLLADARLVRGPDLYPVCSDALLPRDLVQVRREAFLNPRPLPRPERGDAAAPTACDSPCPAAPGSRSAWPP